VGITADQLDAAVLRRAYWPATNAPLSQTDRLAVADEELAGDAFPLVVASGGDYYLVRKDYTIVAGQRFYRLPSRAYGGVADVLWGDDGATDEEFRSLTAMNREDLGQSWVNNPTVSDCSSSSYYLDGDKIGLFPPPGSARGTLRIKFTLHPSHLVLTTSSRVIDITGAGYGTNLEGTTAWTISGTSQYNPDNGAVSDVVSAGNAHSCLMFDAPVESGLGIYAAEWPYDPLVEVGDYLCSAGYTPLLQLPDMMHPYFIRRVAGACLMAAGDREGAAAELQAAAQLYEKVQSAIKPRDEAEPTTIVCRNSALRSRGSFGYPWGR
jgi:hypothetical protein